MSDEKMCLAFDYGEEIRGICESIKRNRFNLTPEMILCEITYLEERLSLASARDVALLQKAREEERERILKRINKELSVKGEDDFEKGMDFALEDLKRFIEKLKSGEMAGKADKKKSVTYSEETTDIRHSQPSDRVENRPSGAGSNPAPAKRQIKHVSKKLRDNLRKVWGVDKKEAEPTAKPRTKRVGDNKK